MGDTRNKQKYTPDEVKTMLDCLNTIYNERLLPLEKKFCFSAFDSPPLTDAFFQSAPYVLVIGQYNVGKTTFIRHILKQDYNGSRIGKDPTTDKFVCISKGNNDDIIPGGAFCSDKSQPFFNISTLGQKYMQRIQGVKCSSPFLDRVSFIDTPGILSGKQKSIDRGYNMSKMIKLLAQVANRVLFIFDIQNLDVFDESKFIIKRLSNHKNKMKFILNKADHTRQELLRLYGNFMWYLGVAFATPQPISVYIGSFWEKPLQNVCIKNIVETDEQTVLLDLMYLPQTVAIEKLAQVASRAERVKIVVTILLYLRQRIGLLGKKRDQKVLLENLSEHFKEICKINHFKKVNLPNVNKFEKVLRHKKIWEFPNKAKKLEKGVDIMKSLNLYTLMELISNEPNDTVDFLKSGNPFEINQRGDVDNRFEVHADLGVYPDWLINGVRQDAYDEIFAKLPSKNGKVSGADCKAILEKSELPENILQQIWTLSDIDLDGKLDWDEFRVSQFLIDMLKSGELCRLPERIPNRMIPPSKRDLFNFDMIEI